MQAESSFEMKSHSNPPAQSWVNYRRVPRIISFLPFFFNYLQGWSLHRLSGQVNTSPTFCAMANGVSIRTLKFFLARQLSTRSVHVLYQYLRLLFTMSRTRHFALWKLTSWTLYRWSHRFENEFHQFSIHLTVHLSSQCLLHQFA